MSSIKTSDTNELIKIYKNFQENYDKYYDYKEDDIYIFIYEYVGKLTYKSEINYLKNLIEEIQVIDDTIIKYLENEFGKNITDCDFKEDNEFLRKSAYHIIVNYVCYKLEL
jgi:hypothetical protein